VDTAVRAAVALTTASHNPAYVLWSIRRTIELSLMLFVVLLLVAFVFGYGLVRLLLAAVHLPAYVRSPHGARQSKARELLDETLTAFFEDAMRRGEGRRAAMELGDTRRCTRSSRRGPHMTARIRQA